MTGMVIRLTTRGYGWILPDDRIADGRSTPRPTDTDLVFFHLDNIKNHPRFGRGCRVSFEMDVDRSGRPAAIDVQVID